MYQRLEYHFLSRTRQPTALEQENRSEGDYYAGSIQGGMEYAPEQVGLKRLGFVKVMDTQKRLFFPCRCPTAGISLIEAVRLLLYSALAARNKEEQVVMAGRFIPRKGGRHGLEPL